MAGSFGDVRYDRSRAIKPLRDPLLTPVRWIPGPGVPWGRRTTVKGAHAMTEGYGR